MNFLTTTLFNLLEIKMVPIEAMGVPLEKNPPFSPNPNLPRIQFIRHTYASVDEVTLMGPNYNGIMSLLNKDIISPNNKISPRACTYVLFLLGGFSLVFGSFLISKWIVKESGTMREPEQPV